MGADTSTSYVVRRPTERDADAIRAVHEAGWRAGYAHLYSADVMERAVEKHCGRWADLFQDPILEETEMLILELDDRVIGFAHFGPTGSRLSSEQRIGRTELYSFYIHPHHWGTGAANVLIGHVVNAVKDQGESELYLSTGVDVARSRAFYEKVGFRETGQTQVYDLLGEVPTRELQYVLSISGTSF